MKILVVMGSPRKGNTYGAAKIIEESMRRIGDVEFEYLMLKEADLAQCTGCFVCFLKGEEHCPRKDDGPLIEHKMQDADGVIFASPVYGMNVSGLFKTFVDRFSYIFHRPRFFDKKALLLTTTGSLGLKEVLDYLDLVARFWGFHVVERVGLVTPPSSFPSPSKEKNEERLRAVGAALYKSLQEQKRPSPGLKDLFYYHAQRASFDELRDLSPTDYQYWKERGWLDKGRAYFVDVPVNPIYHLIGVLLERFIRRQVRSYLAAK